MHNLGICLKLVHTQGCLDLLGVSLSPSIVFCGNGLHLGLFRCIRATARLPKEVSGPIRCVSSFTYQPNTVTIRKVAIVQLVAARIPRVGVNVEPQDSLNIPRPEKIWIVPMPAAEVIPKRRLLRAQGTCGRALRSSSGLILRTACIIGLSVCYTD